MNEQKKEQGSEMYGNVAIFGVCGFFIYMAAQRISIRLLALWHVHPWVCAVLITTLLASVCLLMFGSLWNRISASKAEKEIAMPDNTSVHLGKSAEGEQIHLKQKYRTTHTQVIGTTSAGKTESVILPWAIRDLETKAGLLIIDGKSDKTFLEKFYAYVVKSGRKSDFRLFSLADIEPSSTFNPLVGGSSYEIAERVFSSFTFENEYFKNIQYKLFHAAIRLILNAGVVPSFILVRRLLTDAELLKTWLDRCEDDEVRHDLGNFLKEPDRERTEKVAGLDAHLSHFATGELATLFNASESHIQMDQVLRENLICYFQLPSMYYPTLAAATGRLALQSFQNAVAKRHLGIESKPGFFSCYLDDFQDYIYEGFGALLNKSRSANVGVVFSHQALGDLDKVSPAFKNVVLTNTNVKCVMRNNDPDTCEYFSKSFGTKTTEKTTERQKKNVLGESRTGDGSVREVQEFRFHPNDIRNLGTGEGIVTIPHFKGVKVERVRFKRREDIAPIQLPRVLKEGTPSLKAAYPKTEATKERTRVAPNDLTQTKEPTNESTP
jgi:type IV secretory pathway TraG/TraD family ATPase VirD4